MKHMDSHKKNSNSKIIT